MILQGTLPEESPAPECDLPILCAYVNATNSLQIIRIQNCQDFYLERVVFPGQRLIFEAVAEAILEVHTSEMVTAIAADTISCERLQIPDRFS